jgi:hypothetical protein
MADPVSTLKGIAEIVKKYNDLELMKQIVSLQTEVFDLQTENLELKKNLADKIEMRHGPHGYFYREGDKVPHCPKCWEGDRKVVHLPEPKASAVGNGRSCLVCRTYYREMRGGQ